MKYILSVALALLLSHFSFGQKEKTFIDSVEQTIADIKEELILIKENYYVIQPIGLAGNIGVYVGAEGGVIVDNQWSRLVPRIKELLKALTDKPVKYVINTHYHFDHIDGNKSFGKERVTIVAHKNLRARLLKDQLISGSGFGPILQKAYPPKGLPSITFNNSIELFDDKETIRIIHFPNAHTNGDAIVYFKNADIYYTRDIFVTYGLPVLDENNGGDIYAMIWTIDYLLKVSNSQTRFIPGHGSICTVKELFEYRKLLTSIKDQVVDLMKKGLPLEKIISEVNIDEKIGGVDTTIHFTCLQNGFKAQK